MLLSELKKGLFGYNKESVYRYVMKLNEKYEQRIQEKEELHKKEIMELKQRIIELEMENEELKSVQKAISMTIVEARNFASQIKKDTHEMEQDMRAKLRSKYGLEKKRLESYEESISCGFVN
jgi:cell division septum initiation protein DivIVA